MKKKSFKELLLSPIGKVLIVFLSYLLMCVFIILFARLGGNGTVSTVIAFIFAGICGYFGWKTLNFITPNIFLIMPVAGWVIYYVVKGVLSFLLGIFVAPLYIAKKIIYAISNSAKQDYELHE